MGNKRKISIRKVLQVLLTLLVTAGCIVALLSAARIEDSKRLSGLEVHITNGDNFHFLDEAQVKDMVINNRHVDIKNIPLARLDVRTMEGIITANPWVADAQAYVDNNHILHMYVTQRVPQVRIFEKDGSSYYLDATLREMPLSDNYVHYTSVVTNVPELKDDSTGRSLKAQILTLVKFIEHDSFWNAQVSQIIMDTNNVFEVIPVMGNQHIIVGDTSRLKDKFDNLMVFYKKVMNKIGWDKYETLDLRYKGQVVASPALPWKGPVDKTMSSMSWVKSIIDSSAKVKDDKLDTAHALQKQVPGHPAPLAPKHELKAPVTARNMHKEQPKKETKKENKQSPKYIYKRH